MITPIRLGNIYNNNHFGSSFGGTTWDIRGVSPTLETAQGGNRQPLIVVKEDKMDNVICVASRGRIPKGQTEYVQNYEMLGNETINALTHASKDNMLLGKEYQMEDENQIYRIRKLTPRECFRLMGVRDEDYDKLTVSDTQKYKQAGNSIVVDVLEDIFDNMFVKECKSGRLF